MARLDEEARIQEAGQEVGVSARMLRYWEQQGLLTPSRGPGRHRRYNRHDLLVMKLVKRLMDEHGYTVGEVRLIKKLADQEADLALSSGDDLLILRLLLQRNRAEPYYERLLELHGLGARPRPARPAPPISLSPGAPG